MTQLFPTEVYLTPQELILDILQKTMDLTDDQCITIFPENDLANLNKQLYVMCLLDSNNYKGNRIEQEDIIVSNQVVGVKQKNIFYSSDSIIIELFSKNNDAFNRYREIPCCLNSYYSKLSQQKSGIGIARDPSNMFQINEFYGSNLMLNRYRFTYNVQSSFVKEFDIDYYETFNIVGNVS